MPQYFFRIQHGQHSGTCEQGSKFADRDAAWKELTRVCGDIVGGIARKIKQDSEWRMELLDESRQPVFRIRVVSETL
jgi:hypothetical protein